MPKIDRHTTAREFAEIEKYVSDEQRKAIKEVAVRSLFGEAGFYGMTIGSMLDAMHGNYEGIRQDDGNTVFDIMRIEAFKEWLDEFLSVAETLTPKPTARQVKNSMGTIRLSFDEAVYIFCRSYFGLPNFDAVNELTVGDYLLAKKDDYNQRIVDNNTMN